MVEIAGWEMIFNGLVGMGIRIRELRDFSVPRAVCLAMAMLPAGEVEVVMVAHRSGESTDFCANARGVEVNI